MTTANDRQIGGEHYNTAIQPWDYILANNLGYLEGNIIKYVSRWRTKGGLEDLQKAEHYLEKLIEQATAEMQRTRPVASEAVQFHPPTARSYEPPAE